MQSGEGQAEHSPASCPAHLGHYAELAADVLERVKASSRRFSERLVVELLLKMGYGRSRADAGRAIGGTATRGLTG
jgi:restriction endonuclease Mrr